MPTPSAGVGAEPTTAADRQPAAPLPIESLPPDRAAAWDEADRAARHERLLSNLRALDVEGKAAAAKAAAVVKESEGVGADGMGEIVNVVTYESETLSAESLGDEDDRDEESDLFSGESLSFIATDDGDGSLRLASSLPAPTDEESVQNPRDNRDIGGKGAGTMAAVRGRSAEPRWLGGGGGRGGGVGRYRVDENDEEDDSLAQEVERALSLSPVPIMPPSTTKKKSVSTTALTTASSYTSELADNVPAALASSMQELNYSTCSSVADLRSLPPAAGVSAPQSSHVVDFSVCSSVMDLRSVPPACSEGTATVDAAVPTPPASSGPSAAGSSALIEMGATQLNRLNYSLCSSVTDLRSVPPPHNSTAAVPATALTGPPVNTTDGATSLEGAASVHRLNHSACSSVTDLHSVPSNEEREIDRLSRKYGLPAVGTAVAAAEDKKDDKREETERLPPLPPQDVERSAAASAGFDPIVGSSSGAAANDGVPAGSGGSAPGRPSGLNDAMRWLVGSGGGACNGEGASEAATPHVGSSGEGVQMGLETETPLVSNMSLDGARPFASQSKEVMEVVSAAGDAALVPTLVPVDQATANETAAPLPTPTQKPVSTPALLAENRPDEIESLSASKIRALEMTLRHVQTQCRALQNQTNRDRLRMENMSMEKSEAMEELDLVKAQWREFLAAHHPDALRGCSPGTSLKELRGELLQRGREELSVLEDEASRLRAALEESQQGASAERVALASENDALKEEVQNLSDRLAQRAMVENDAVRRLERLDETSQRTEEHLVAKAAAADATADELRRQLGDAQRRGDSEADRAVRAEGEREEWRGRAEDVERELGAAREELQATARDRDALRGELAELVRSRENPQMTMEREFTAEIDRLKREASQGKGEAKRRMEAAEQMDKERREQLSRAKRSEAQAVADAERAREELGAIKRQILSLDEAGALGTVDAKAILGDVARNGSFVSKSMSTGADKEAVSSQLRIPMTASTVGASTQTDVCNEVDTSSTPTASVGINTAISATFATELYAEGLQARTALHASEMRTSQLQIENANLRGRCEHLEGQTQRLEARLQKINVGNLTSPLVNERAQEADKLAKECEELRLANAAMQQESSSIAEARAFVEEENKRAMERCVSLEKLAEEATAECERLTKELGTVREKLDEMKEQKSNEYETDGLKEEARRISEERDAALTECQRLSSQILAAQQELVDFQVKNEAEHQALQRCENMKELLEAEKTQLEKRLEKLVQLEASVQAINEQKATMEKEKAEAQDRMNKYEEEIASLKENVATLTLLEGASDQELQRLRGEAATLREGIVQLEKSLIEKEAERVRLETKCSALTDEKRSIDESKAHAEGTIKRLEQEVSSVRENLASLDRSGRLHHDDQLRSVKEKLSLYEFSLVVSEEKVDALTAEKSLIEKTLQGLRTEMDSKERVIVDLEGERVRLEGNAATLKETVEACKEELELVHKDLQDVRCENIKLKESLISSQKQKEALEESRKKLSIQAGQMQKETEAMQSKAHSFELELLRANEQLAAITEAKTDLEFQLQASEKEWRECVVQADSLLKTVDYTHSSTQTVEDNKPHPTIATTPSDQISPGGVKLAPSTVKQLLSEVRASFEAACADREETLLTARLSADKEIQTLRLGLNAAEEEIRLLRKRNAAGCEDCSSTTKTGSIDEERLLRIRVAKEQASMAAAHHKQLSLVGFKSQSKSTRGLRQKDKEDVSSTTQFDEVLQRSGTEAGSLEQSLVDMQEKHEAEKSLLRTKYRERFRCLSKNWDDEKRAIFALLEKEGQSQEHIAQKDAASDSPVVAKTPGASKKIVFVPTPASYHRKTKLSNSAAVAPGAKSRAKSDSFCETEKFVMDILNSCNKS